MGGYPRAHVEALACGVPVVSTDVGDVRSLIRPDNGRLVGPRDPAALITAMEEVAWRTTRRSVSDSVARLDARLVVPKLLNEAEAVLLSSARRLGAKEDQVTARTLQTTDGKHDHATGVYSGDAPPASPSGRASSVDTVASHPRTVCSTCIVTFNSRATIGRLLKSVAEAGIATGYGFDNTSTDDTVQVILAESARLGLELTLQVSQVNMGFPRICNELLGLSCEPVIAVINPDVELTPGVLEHLAGVAHSDGSIGIVTCRLMTRSGRAQTAPARSRPRLRHLVVRDLPRRVGDVMRVGRPDPLSVDRDVE